ncbi:MAG TPA: copper oxidase [Thermoplasmata archaeon]|nr:copper oxidase [Thermoplasmata archaeon]
MARFPRAAATPGSSLAAIGAVTMLVAVGLGVVGSLQAPVASGVTRNYYIAADPVLWNYTPSMTNEITGEPLGAHNATESFYTGRNATYLGATFEKCVYEQYSDASFTALLPRPASEAYLGLLGPVIYAAVGDTINVTFRNNCPFLESLAPQGVQVAPQDDGTNYNGSFYLGGSVPTYGTVQYSWQVPYSAGPGSSGAGATMWLYDSGKQFVNSTDVGLLGPIIISAQGMDHPDGTPIGSAANPILLFNVYNETDSPYLRYNVEHLAEDPAIVNVKDPVWVDSLNKYAINGYLYGNLPMLTFPQGTQVHWWLIAMGQGLHTASWPGDPVLVGGARTDLLGLAPGVTTCATMWANATGVGLVESVVPADLLGGMQARYDVVPASTPGVTAAGSPPWGAVDPYRSGSVPVRTDGTRLPASGADAPGIWGAVRWV